jgi:hypothetical protein
MFFNEKINNFDATVNSYREARLNKVDDAT